MSHHKVTLDEKNHIKISFENLKISEDSIKNKENKGVANDNEDSLNNILPPKVSRRVNALKKLQLRYTFLEAEFYKCVHELECRFSAHYAKVFERREEIVSGAYEPTDEESEFVTGGETQTLSKEVLDKICVVNGMKKIDPDIPGVPFFWLTIFKNVAMLNDMVQPHDEPILAHLQDIRVKLLEKDPMGFILEFVFSENPFFTNKVLTKEYTMKCLPDDDDPFNFEGPEIHQCKGCAINWNSGKDITVKVLKKKQKHKSKGAFRTITKLVKNHTFFNFFAPPIVKEGGESELDEETQILLTSDFEIGYYIKDRIVPNAVLYYTGEALDDEEDYDDEDDDDESESEEMSSESDNDEVYFHKYRPEDEKVTEKDAQQAPECKQQ